MNDLLPPTVPVPLSALLADASLGLRRVAGPEADRDVHAVHTSEMEDPVPYLLGGELLLSAGVKGPADANGRAAAAYWDRYVARTVEAGAAALGFGVAPVHEAVPTPLAEACDRHGLPLLEVPRRTPFTAVARAMWQAVAERRHRVLQRMSEGQQALAVAAAGPHPVPAVLHRLARHLDGWAVLLDPDGAPLAEGGTPPAPAVRVALVALAARLRPGRSSAAAAEAGRHLSVYGLPAASGPGPAALGVCAPARDAGGAALAGVAVVLLSLLAGARSAAADAARSAALVRLLLGAAPADVAPLLDAGERWTVVHGCRRGPEEGDGPLAAADVAAGLGTHLVDLDGGRLRALVAGAERIAPLPGWTLGVAGPVPASGLAGADAEAARALRRALARRVALAGATAGSGEGLAGLVVPEEAREHARTVLAPLEERPALVETLRMWLSLHGSWDRTATALQVHRNTVRQRLARIAALLDRDLDDPHVRMELWFALTWR